MSSGSSSASVYGAFIIGCGPAGMSIAYLLKGKVPYVLVEKEDKPAPLWRCHTYPLTLQQPKAQCRLLNVPVPDRFPDHLSNKDMVEYIDICMEEFKIEAQFYEKVISAKFDELNQFWEIVTESTNPKKPKTRNEYRSYTLVVATGLNSEAKIPVINGLTTFQGKKMHSRDYKNAEDFKGKRVAVIGGGRSGVDITLDLKLDTKLVYNVVKNMENNMPKWVTDYHEKECQSNQQPYLVMPEIEKCEGNRVWFKNGKWIDTDSFVFATGYKTSFLDWLQQQGSEFFRTEDGCPKHWKGPNGSYFPAFSHGGRLEVVSNHSELIADHAYNYFEEK